MLITWLDPSAGVNRIHPLMLYSDPTYILLLTLIWGPSQLPMRPTVSKLCVSPLGSATGGVALVRVELPERELHPSRSYLKAARTLQCFHRLRPCRSLLFWLRSLLLGSCCQARPAGRKH